MILCGHGFLPATSSTDRSGPPLIGFGFDAEGGLVHELQDGGIILFGMKNGSLAKLYLGPIPLLYKKSKLTRNRTCFFFFWVT